MSEFDGSIVVSGASGFVGNCLVRRLLGAGHDVHVLLRPEARFWRLAGLEDKITVHTAGLLDRAGLQKAISAIKPAAVYHLATYGAYESQADALQVLTTNVIGSYNLFESALQTGATLLVNAGSSSEYGYCNDPMKESNRIEPNSIYAVAKAAQTHLCTLLGKGALGAKTSTVTFRLFSVYGPWEEPTRLFPTMIRRIRAGLPLEMVSPDTSRDFIYVDDVLDAMTQFKQLATMKGEVLNLGSGKQCTLRELINTILDVLGSHSEVRWGAMNARRWDASRWEADMDHTRQLMHWSPRISLREGIARMAAWMCEVGDNYGPG